MRIRRIKQEVQVKEMALSDVVKRNTEAEQRLNEFGAMYDVIKNEKNKCVGGYVDIILKTLK